MRFSDFKLIESKKLNEAANAGLEVQHALHDLDAIKKAVPLIPDEKSQEKVALTNDIKAINGLLKKAIEYFKGNTEAPIAEDETAVGDKMTALKGLQQEDKELEEELELMRQQYDEMAKLQILDAGEATKRDDILARATKSLDKVTAKFESIRLQRDTAIAERDEAVKFIKDVTGVLVTLGNKVQGFRADEDLSNFSGKEKTAYKKMAVNAQKFTKTLKQALFGKILDMQEGSDVSGQEIKEFLEACVRGDVINMLNVIGTSQGNIKDHVNPKYQKVFDVFVEENIFSYAPGTTSGAIGPGEMALSMMGNPAEKGKKGDLKIGDEEVEIKASAKTGGRFNSKAIAKATTGWQTWAQKINEIMSQAPKDATISVTQKDGSEKLIPAREYNGNRHNVIKGKAKKGSKYNWNSSGFKALNIEVLQPYSNLRQTFDLFESTIRALVQNYDKLDKPQQDNSHHKPFNPGDLIEAAINDDGTVDPKKMNIAYSKIAYASYHLADGITTVMLLRTDNLSYTIFRNADDLVDQMNNNTVTTGGGFNWNDDQQTPTPGYIAS